MADGTIWDQTQETALTAAHRVLVQDTSAATASTSATFGLMGGLETNNQTVTTTDITGAVGQLYVCTIAGLTAERSLTLPSAQVGERIGVYIVDGDATYELVVKGAASQTINGGTAATEWSRLFIQGECCVFRCVAANTWIVEYDGTHAPSCIVEGDGGANMTIGNATFTDIIGSTGGPLDTVVTDRHSWYTASTGRITPTISGRYLVTGVYVVGEADDGKRCIANVYKNGSAVSLLGRVSSSFASQYIGGAGSAIVDCNGTTDYLNLTVWSNDPNNVGVTSAAAALNFTATLMERL